MSSVQRLSLLAIPILGVMTGNAALSLDMYLPAFPAIAGDFGVPEGNVQITMSTFLAGFAIGQAVYGPLSDAFGRRPVILAALLIYGAISALCALSPGIGSLALLRALQGLAGASGSVLGRAVIRDVYDGTRLLKAMSMLMMVLTAAPMAAPLIGSVVLDLWGWRSIFWTLATYAMVWSVLIALTIPETWPKERRLSIHPLAVARVFVQVMRHKHAMGYTLTVGFGFAGMFAYIAATPFIYMDTYGVSPQGYALFFAANIVSMAAFSWANGRLAGRFGRDQLLGALTWVLVIAAVILMGAGYTGFGGVWGLAVPLFFYVGCLSAVAANGIAGTLQSFGHSAGTASSVFGLFQFGLGSLAGGIMAAFESVDAVTLAGFILICGGVAFTTFRVLAQEKNQNT